MLTQPVSSTTILVGYAVLIDWTLGVVALTCSISLRHLLADNVKGEAWLHPSAC
jgi:hypothetical protein